VRKKELWEGRRSSQRRWRGECLLELVTPAAGALLELPLEHRLACLQLAHLAAQLSQSTNTRCRQTATAFGSGTLSARRLGKTGASGGALARCRCSSRAGARARPAVRVLSSSTWGPGRWRMTKPVAARRPPQLGRQASLADCVSAPSTRARTRARRPHRIVAAHARAQTGTGASPPARCTASSSVHSLTLRRPKGTTDVARRGW
jgi:hypothetical protein